MENKIPFQTVFKRYELKYILTLEQKEIILSVIKPYMQLDKYGRTTIRNLYNELNKLEFDARKKRDRLWYLTAYQKFFH